MHLKPTNPSPPVQDTPLAVATNSYGLHARTPSDRRSVCSAACTVASRAQAKQRNRKMAP